MAKFWETPGAQPVVASGGNARLEAALAYVEKLQWAVVPLHWIDQGRCSCGDPHENDNSAGKHPNKKFALHGVHSGSKDAATVRKWFTDEPRLNIGIATGEVSGFVVLDVDPRNGGDDTLAEFVGKFGALPETAAAFTGGGGQHFLFRYNGQGVKSPDSKRGLDAKGNGGFIVVAPSSHKSGKVYEWEGEFDPLEGAPIAEPPLWMLAAPRKTVSTPHFLSTGATGFLSPQRISDLRAILSDPRYSADSYERWISTGQALHSTDAVEAFQLYDEYSQRSDKYVPGDPLKKWNTFKSCGGLNVESIFEWAKDDGIDITKLPRIAEDVPEEQIQIEPPKIIDLDAPPSHLLTVPGVLGDLVNEINRTAPKKQPQFAVEAALVFGCTVTGRRYRTTNDNFSSLYFLSVGESGCGKEYARKIVEKALTDCKLENLISGSGYHSDSAIHSELEEKPSHVAMIDEFGAMLRNAAAPNASNKRSGIELLKSIWGQLNGIIRPVARSRASLNAQQKANSKIKNIVFPAITLLGMSTPKQFYESLTEDAIEAGFLARLIIVHTNIGRKPSIGLPLKFVTPQTVIDWAGATRSGEGNLTQFELACDLEPTLIEVPFATDAWAALSAYEVESVARADDLEREGLAQLENRSREKAMRLALALAVSDSPLTPTIQLAHAQWAIDYVRHYTAQMVAAVREHMFTSKFAKWRKEALKLIQRNSLLGRTERELRNYSRHLEGLTPKVLSEVLDSLAADGSIKFGKVERAKKAREAWLPLKQDDDEDS